VHHHLGSQRRRGAAGTYLPLAPMVVVLVLLLVGLAGRPSPGLAAPTAPAGAAAPTTTVTPLYLGHGVGIVGTYPTTGSGCPHLFSTTDFRHWRDISPPQPPSSVDPCAYVWTSASFISPTQGWVLGRNGGAIETVLYRTVDGGASWTKEPGSTTGSNGGQQVIGFTSAADGWRQQFATGSNGPSLLETTADGGASWTELPQASTNGGCEFALDAFANPADGYAAPGLGEAFGAPPPQSFLWRTVDGGRSWTPFSLPRPPGVTGVATDDDPPTFLTPTLGIVPVSYGLGGRTSNLAFYASANSGNSWTLVSVRRSRSTQDRSTPAPVIGSPTCGASAGPAPAAPPSVVVASASVWWVMAPGQRSVAVTADRGAAWTQVRTTGLHPTGAALSYLGAANARVAWATTTNESVGAQSFQTTDGGRTWSPLRVTGLPVSGRTGASPAT
jgi:photosystem II stability/assembly factor-like uncharacterized protein